MALNRPGPWGAGLTERLVALRHGEVAPELPHPLIEPIVAGTRGLVIYQEQMVQIAVSVAGYSLDEADVFRRALAKGRLEGVGAERDRFVMAALRAGVPWVEAVLLFSRLRRGTARLQPQPRPLVRLARLLGGLPRVARGGQFPDA